MPLIKQPLPRDCLQGFQLSNGATIAGQVADFVRSHIRSGALPPGQEVPSTRVLAGRWDIDPATIQSGLSRLVKEGLLLRVVGRGTCVRPRTRQLQRVGVHLAHDVRSIDEAAFGRALLAEIHRQLASERLTMRTFFDTQPERREKFRVGPEVSQACACGEIDALLVINHHPGQEPWLERLPVPVTFRSSRTHPTCVCTDTAQYLDLALAGLARQGCRTAGLVSAMTFARRDGPRMSELFARTAARHRIRVKASWVKVPHGRLMEGGHEQYGYEQFKQLWAAPEHPAGLAVYDDFVARGVLMALGEAQARVPADLKLVLYRNREVGLFCPVPAAFVEMSVREMAATLIAHLKRQFQEGPTQPATVPLHFVAPSTDHYENHPGKFNSF